MRNKINWKEFRMVYIWKFWKGIAIISRKTKNYIFRRL